MRVRWGNVGRVLCLAAAGVLIAIGPPEGRPPPSPPPDGALPRLADVPRLLQPRPRERRALKGGASAGREGPPEVSRALRGQRTEVPALPSPTPPSPPPDPAVQSPPPERSAPAPPTSGEFTPDPAP